jgi:hypothetical protein
MDIGKLDSESRDLGSCYFRSGVPTLTRASRFPLSLAREGLGERVARSSLSRGIL